MASAFAAWVTGYSSFSAAAAAGYGAAAAYAAAYVVAAVGLSYALGKLMAPSASDLMAEKRDLKRTIRSSVSPRKIVYGQTMLGGSLIFVSSTGTSNKYLHMVIALAGHEVEEIGEIYLNDTISTDIRFTTGSSGWWSVVGGKFRKSVVRENTTTLSVGDEIKTQGFNNAENINTYIITDITFVEVVGYPGTYYLDIGVAETLVNEVVLETKQLGRPAVRVNKHLGTDAQVADSDLMAEVSEWTSAHRLRGIAYIYIRLEFDPKIWLTGIPQVRCIVKGKKIYNPVTTLTEWTDNWALCVRDYLVSNYGMRCTDAEIDTSMMNAAISTSDEIVESIGEGPVPGLISHTAPKYLTINWKAGNATWTYTNYLATLTPTATDPVIRHTTFNWFSGAERPLVKVRLKRKTGTSWQGSCYYVTSGHGESASFQKTIPEPANIDTEFVTAIFDMSNLTAGGSDWVNNTIRELRLDLSADATTTYEIKAIYVTMQDIRYSCNGAFSLDQKPAEVMEKLLTAGAGALVFSQGKYKLYAGEYHTPTVTLDESDLRDEIQVTANTKKKDLFNTVKGIYTDPLEFYSSVSFPKVTNSTYVTSDKEELVREIQLPFTQDKFTAQRIARIHLEKSRQSIICKYPCKLTALQVTAMDTVMINNTRLGWVNKVFRVISWEFSQDGGVDLELQEEASASYNWSSNNAVYTDPAINTVLPNPWFLKKVTGLTATQPDLPFVAADGTYRTNLHINWTRVDNEQHHFIIEYKKSSDSIYLPAGNTIETNHIIPNLLATGTEYDIRVRAESLIGVQSDWEDSLDFALTGTGSPIYDNQLLNNLIDPGQWTVGSTGTQGDFTAIGSVAENNIILSEGPFGHSQPLWECVNDVASDADGGWNHSTIAGFDHTKSYRFMVFVKRNQADGTTYFGCHSTHTNNLDGTANANPYFWSGDLPEWDKWYLLVGIVHGSDWGTVDTNIAGVYDTVTGLRVLAGFEFKNKVTATAQRHRAYLYYATDTATRQYFANPRVDELNGSEVPLTTILGAADVTETRLGHNLILNGDFRKDGVGVLTPVNWDSGVGGADKLYALWQTVAGDHPPWGDSQIVYKAEIFSGTGLFGLFTENYIVIDESLNYNVNAWFKRKSGNNPITMGLYCFDSAQVQLATEQAFFNYPITTSWKRLDASYGPNGGFSFPAGTKYVKIIIYIIDSTGGVGANLCSRVQLNEGLIPQPWNPIPKDSDNTGETILNPLPPLFWSTYFESISGFEQLANDGSITISSVNYLKLTLGNTATAYADIKFDRSASSAFSWAYERKINIDIFIPNQTRNTYVYVGMGDVNGTNFFGLRFNLSLTSNWINPIRNTVVGPAFGTRVGDAKHELYIRRLGSTGETHYYLDDVYANTQPSAASADQGILFQTRMEAFAANTGPSEARVISAKFWQQRV